MVVSICKVHKKFSLPLREKIVKSAPRLSLIVSESQHLYD